MGSETILNACVTQAEKNELLSWEDADKLCEYVKVPTVVEIFALVYKLILEILHFEHQQIA